MSNKFYGSIDELKSAVGKAGFVGNWEEKAGTAVSYQFLGRTGEVLNWWPSSGTLSFQGKNGGSFQSALMPLLQGVQPTLVRPATNENGKRIFIVHGHDTTARDQLELILMRLGLQPFILQNSDAGSKTIVEALEVNIYQESALGIILMTPDDYGYAKNQTEADR